MLTIEQISTKTDHADAVELVREMAEWAISLSSDTSEAPAFDTLEQETADLTSVYVPPKGCFLLAREDGEPVGCGALTDLGNDVVEVKRMYIRPSQRGKGTGYKLTEALVDHARKTGAKRIILDSYHTMTSAHKIYRAVGFKDIAAPEGFPEAFVDRVVFMEMHID